MKCLGVFGGQAPNPSAVLLVDGRLVAFVEEERLNRIKLAPHHFPTRAIRECLRIGGLTLDDIDEIAYAWDSPRYSAGADGFFERLKEEYDDPCEFNEVQQELIFNIYHPLRVTRSLQLGVGALSATKTVPPVKYYPHHLCHAASTFFCSGFERANILTLDGSGEEVTTLLCEGSGTRIRALKRFHLPHTLGGYYATFTEFLGFRPYMDEGKVMGLASYGTYSAEIQERLDRFIDYDRESGDFRVDPRLRFAGEHTHGGRFTDALVDLFGPMRATGQSALEAPYPDIAFNVQWRLEQIVLLLARQLYELNPCGNFCLAGGVAMNCVANGRLASADFVDDIFVQPAASDNGSALGAAQLLARERGDEVRFKMTHAYYGPSYSDAEIAKAVAEAKLPSRRCADVEAEVARLLHEGKIVGWVQGPMEVGARALGNRSILANPLLPGMKDKLNHEVKHREGWRPFCPAMKAESYRTYMEAPVDSPFMILAFPFRREYRELFPSCVHVDGTGRPQAVRREDNPRFWKLLDEFEKVSGHGILINTSFNVQGEPIVCSPQDALRCFGGTGIDVLVLGDVVLQKEALHRTRDAEHVDERLVVG